MQPKKRTTVPIGDVVERYAVTDPDIRNYFSQFTHDSEDATPEWLDAQIFSESDDSE